MFLALTCFFMDYESFFNKFGVILATVIKKKVKLYIKLMMDG